MQKIVTLTLNPCVDKSTAVDSVASEIKLRCDEPTYEPGGGGVNVSRAIKKLGGESVAVYLSGGSTGQHLTELLHREGVTTLPINTQTVTRENLIVFERNTRLQFRFGMPGAHITDAELSASMDAVFAEHPDIIVASGSLPPGVSDDFYAQLVKRAHVKNIRIIVDTSGVALERLVGTAPFLLKPNINELEHLSGEKFEGEEQMLRVARRMIQEDMAEVLVISLGSQGAAMISATEAVQLRPPTVPIYSKVGAGDSMVGGIVYSLAKGDDLTTAVRYGVASGTACVMNPGGELCRIQDVEKIYPRVKIEALDHDGL